MYTKKTGSILIKVRPIYLEEQSDPQEGYFVWAYHVQIENQGRTPVQLRKRFWRIIDARGQVQEIQGEGVIGEQPVLKAGESYEYTSGAPLSTPSGIMEGSYEMEGIEGDYFKVGIPAFSLDSPHQEVILN